MEYQFFCLSNRVLLKMIKHKPNETNYKKPIKPIVIVCMDGCAPEYITKAIEAGKAPTFQRFMKNGFYAIANSIIPSYTNPNNISIVTGTFPNVNGITGNWVYNKNTEKEEDMNSPAYLKCDTLLKTFSDANLRAGVITTKDKLRLLLSKGWNGIQLSSELAHATTQCTLKTSNISKVIGKTLSKKDVSIPAITDNWMYSGEPSHYTLDLAVAIIKGKGPYVPEVLYTTLTDYIPHRMEPGSDVKSDKDSVMGANQFIEGIDKRLAKLDKLGCIIGITSDHGMNDKHNLDGSPKAIWLNTVLKQEGIKEYKTILPITDKYIAHHGALGSCAWIHLSSKDDINKVINILKKIDGIERAITGEQAAKEYHLPIDLIGDIFLLGDKNTVFGTTKEKHKNIPKNLRSHGGLHEQKVPFIINKGLNKKYLKKSKSGLFNKDIFEFVINGTKP